jgi:hypothetical protein
VTNTLEWRINSEVAGEVVCEIRCFTSGISWAADYVAEAEKTEKLMALAGSVRVNNGSGEDYENAQVRLVVGVIRLVEDIAQLARQGRPVGQGQVWSVSGKLDDSEVRQRQQAEVFFANGLVRGEEVAKRKDIVKEALSEYFLYSVEGRDTIPNGWSKRLPSFQAAAVPIISYYKFERERWGDQVMRYYRFTNAEPSKLGQEPLPDGEVKSFRTVTDDNLYAFVGSTSVKYIPVNESVEMELGIDREVLVKPTLMNWEKTNLQFDPHGDVKVWTIKETWQIEVQNSKDIDVMLDIRQNFSGDWSLKTEARFEKVDATKVKFLLPLKPREKQQFSYDETTNYGLNVTR